MGFSSLPDFLRFFTSGNWLAWPNGEWLAWSIFGLWLGLAIILTYLPLAAMEEKERGSKAGLWG